MPDRTFKLPTGKADVNCALDEDGLIWGDPPFRVSYAELRGVRIYGLPGWGAYGVKGADPTLGCAITPKKGKSLTIVASYAGVDREADFRAFLAQLLERLRAFPSVPVFWGFTRPAWVLCLLFCVVMWGTFLFAVVLMAAAVMSLFGWKDPAGDLFGIALVALYFLATFQISMATTRMLRNERPRRFTSDDKERMIRSGVESR
jgi:hypothetical protein